MSKMNKKWRGDGLTTRIIKVAEACGLEPRYPKVYKYINLFGSGLTVAQIHWHIERDTGRILVIGDAADDCPSEGPLELIHIPPNDTSALSGDHGSCIRWLRAHAKPFHRLQPAKAFFIKDNAMKRSDRCREWKTIVSLLEYAIERGEIRKKQDKFL